MVHLPSCLRLGAARLCFATSLLATHTPIEFERKLPNLELLCVYVYHRTLNENAGLQRIGPALDSRQVSDIQRVLSNPTTAAGYTRAPEYSKSHVENLPDV